MSYPLTPLELQQPEVMVAQRREWKIERAGWLVIAGVLLAGMLGGLGGGPIAHAARTAGAAHLDFDRLVRHGVATDLRLVIGPEAAVNGQIQVALDWEYLAAMQIRDILPAPLRSRSVEGRLLLEFAATAGAATPVVLELEPHAAGRHTGYLTVGDGPALEFAQIVYP